MATTALARNVDARRSNVATSRRSEASQEVWQTPSRMRRYQPSPTPHLTREEYMRLLAFLEDAGGVITIDAISRALPHVLQPISAVFDLCDAGILNVDWESALDADMHVWRTDR